MTLTDVVAFLASLTSPGYKEQGLKELARQRALTGENSAARYGEGFCTEAIPAQTASALIATWGFNPGTSKSGG
jgi:hypothetical protein